MGTSNFFEAIPAPTPSVMKSDLIKYSFSVIAFLLGLSGGPAFASAATIPEITLSIGTTTEVVPKETVSSWFHITSIEILDVVTPPEIGDTHLCHQGYNLCDFVQPQENRTQVKTIPFLTVDEEGLKRSLEAFALRTDTDPQDAVFGGDENGKVFVAVPETFGQSLDTTKSFEVLTQALTKNDQASLSLTLPVTSVAPRIRGDDAERLGIKELIGSGTSNFKGSPKNRVYNIKRSLEQFQSLIIPAGEEFSFVEHLGEVDEANGYLPELVIRNNKTEPEFGGGVCQVSSTVFRAAIYSGMKITERRNHSYPVQYYLPYGMDATIYIPKPDFKFLNNTGNAIMMQSVIEGTKLTFQFFGTRDGREVSVDGPYILERNPDGSMKTTFTQIVKDAAGQEMIKDEFKSNYKSPSLFPHPGEEQKLTAKPVDWSNRQWHEYKKLNP